MKKEIVTILSALAVGVFTSAASASPESASASADDKKLPVVIADVRLGVGGAYDWGEKKWLNGLEDIPNSSISIMAAIPNKPRWYIGFQTYYIPFGENGRLESIKLSFMPAGGLSLPLLASRRVWFTSQAAIGPVLSPGGIATMVSETISVQLFQSPYKLVPSLGIGGGVSAGFIGAGYGIVLSPATAYFQISLYP